MKPSHISGCAESCSETGTSDRRGCLRPCYFLRFKSANSYSAVSEKAASADADGVNMRSVSLEVGDDFIILSDAVRNLM